MLMCLHSISNIAATLATLPNLQYVNLGYNMLDGQLHRSCTLTSTKARSKNAFQCRSIYLSPLYAVQPHCQRMNEH